MAANTDTITLLNAYLEGRVEPRGFGSGFFPVRPGNIHSSQFVEWDVMRGQKKLSIPVQDIASGFRYNSRDKYTTKKIAPATHMEAVPLTSFDLLKRLPGNNPYEKTRDPSFRADVMDEIMNAAAQQQTMIQRAVEQQAWQVLQTGQISQVDSAGNVVYSADFLPKATHFASVGTSWASATFAQKMANLETMCDLVRDDGKRDPDILIMGTAAMTNLLQTTEFQALLDNRRIEQGMISLLEERGNGGQYRGLLEVGNYQLRIWTFNDTYDDPQTGNPTPYMDPNKAIVMSSQSHFDGTFGYIPHVGQALGMQTGINLPGLSGRLSLGERDFDMFSHVWLSPDGFNAFVGLGSRPLCVPTSIDTFACFTLIT